MRPDPPTGPEQDDPDYVPPEPTYDVNEIPELGLDLDTYVDEDLKGEGESPDVVRLVEIPYEEEEP